MNDKKKIELLQKQIDAAENGSVADWQLWRDKTDVILRNVLGDGSPIYSDFRNIRYTLNVVHGGTTQDDYRRARLRGVQRAISLLEAAKTEVEVSGGLPEAPMGSEPAGSTIFIVHGRDEASKHEVARFVQDVTSRKPIILSEQSNDGLTLIEKFEQAAQDAAYAIVISTGDDVGRLSDELDADLKPRARQNVVFELGYFFGALGRNRVTMLYQNDVERPSDTDGFVHIPLDQNGGWKLPLAKNMNKAGIGIDWEALAE